MDRTPPAASGLPPSGSRASGSRASFRPRATLGLLYMFGFFWLFLLLLTAPTMLELSADPTVSIEAAGTRAREIVVPRLRLAIAAAVIATCAGAWAGVLPGLRERR